MLNASSVTREQFISWIGNVFKPSPKLVDVYKLRDIAEHGDVCLIWRNDPDQDVGPMSGPLIVVQDKNIRDFFAFVSTYVGNYQPFSAFFRVVKLSHAIEFVFDRHYQSQLRAGKFVGAIIAEARSQLGEPFREISEITIQSSLATLSFPAVAGIVNGFERENYSEIFRNWIKSRQNLTDESLTVPSDRIREFWEIVKSAVDRTFDNDRSGGDHDIAKLVSAVVESDDIDPRSWHFLTERLPRSRMELEKMRDSREERVRAMDNISEEILLNRTAPQIAEVLLGYAASRVASGSLRYFPILEKFERRFPLASMWYGLFCSLRADTDALVVGDCLGRRVLRHLNGTLNIFAKPTCDISFDEFAVVMASPKPPRWRTEHQNLISIEILPGISSVFRLNSRTSRKEAEYTGPSVSVDVLQEVRYLTHRLAKIMESVDVPKQGRLFTEDRETRFRKAPRKNDR